MRMESYFAASASSKEQKSMKKCGNPIQNVQDKVDWHELKKISSWNLPSTIVREYYIKGISEMFDWQVKCLCKPKVLFENGNLIYSAPTSAGKTLVSEILMIKSIIERSKKALLILPFISVVREKMLYLQDILTPSGYRVEGYFGGYSPPGGFDTIDVAVCTIEKANSIVNILIEEGRLAEIGIVVVDEIHLLTDPGRGYILELLLAKIIYMSTQFAYNIQIVGMSATLTNIEILRNWLNCDLYISDYRPVQLKEMIKIGNTIYDNAMKFVRELKSNDLIIINNDEDHIAYLCIETILEMCSVLIFCPSKDWCETLCTHIARSIHDLSKKSTAIGTKLKKIFETKKIFELKTELKNFPFGLDIVLEKTINYGCAFHHAGLTIEERDIIEKSFKNGTIKVLIATSTLSSGVNLPARRVIIRSPLFGGQQMDSLTYKQMIGRAGRTGIDIIGESILICTDKNMQCGKSLITSNSYNISSCLGLENNMYLKRAILEVVSAGVTQSKMDLQHFLKCTLFLNEHKHLLECDVKINNILDLCLDYLIEYEFIRLQRNVLNDKIYIPTRLGIACLASSLPTSDGLILLAELQKSRRCFVLESDLHAVYLVTPYSVCFQIYNLDWLLYINIWEDLPLNLKKVGELIGVKEAFLVQAMRGHSKLDFKTLQIHKRFYISLALNDIVNEVPLGVVAKKYNCNRGLLQSLQQTASTFAGVVNAFCKSLNWNSLALIISQFKERLYFGVHQDLVDLIKLPDINSQRARALYNSGITNLMALANSDICTVENVLHNCVVFETEKLFEDEDEIERNKRKNIRNIHITGSRTLSIKEAAEKFISAARKYLEFEIGAKNIEWCTVDLENDIRSKISNIQMKAENINIGNVTKVDNLNRINNSVSIISEKADTIIVSTKNLLKNSKNNKTKKLYNSTEKISLNHLEKKNKTDVDVKFSTALKESPNITLFKTNISQQWNSSHILSSRKIENNPISFDSIVIIDICGNINLFEKSMSEILQAKTLGFSIATQKITESKITLIGGNHFHNQHVIQNRNENMFDFIFDEFYFISGISFCFGNNISYFLNMQKSNTCQRISKTMKLKALRDIVGSERNTLRIQDAKHQLKICLKAISSISIKAKIEDSKIANWLLQPDQNSSLRNMSKMFAPECYSLVDIFANNQNNSSKCVRIRSSLKSTITYHIISNQLENLARLAGGNYKFFFYELEMPIQNSLMVMENFGFAINLNAVTLLAQDIRAIMNKMENKAYELHGSRFNLSSTSSVAKILGIQKENNGKFCTSKAILEKIDSALSKLILSYRKLSTTLSKMLIPIIKNIQNNRIHGNNCTFTTTGRISMSEPNLQNVPKDFEITIPERRLISCKRLFIAPNGKYLVSADFSQIEIRILVHLSQDSVLKEAIQSEKDVFSSIAAKWNNISEENISKELRNRTKQICYGIIYGMGVKTLSESLKCTEQQALSMAKQFHIAYPGIRLYLKKLIKFARENGYIETVTGRRRYLKHINNDNLCLRSSSIYKNIKDSRNIYILLGQAERQAINSTIQGSAADITKSAMLRMEKNLLKYKRKLALSLEDQDSKVNLVHHIHDELIYEVAENNVSNVSKILKSAMENCAKLSTPLQVKLKIGESWGNMQEI